MISSSTGNLSMKQALVRRSTLNRLRRFLPRPALDLGLPFRHRSPMGVGQFGVAGDHPRTLLIQGQDLPDDQGRGHRDELWSEPPPAALRPWPVERCLAPPGDGFVPSAGWLTALVSDTTIALVLRALRQVRMGNSGQYHLPRRPKPPACAIGADRSFVVGLPERR